MRDIGAAETGCFVLTHIFDTVCQGGTYTFADGAINDSIQPIHPYYRYYNYTANIPLANGCDSIIETQLYVSQSFTSWRIIEICINSSFTLPNGTILTNITTNSYHTLNYNFGCDSTYSFTISPSDTLYYTNYDSICLGENYTFADGIIQTNITSQISHFSNLTSIYGCDSILETIVKIRPIGNQTVFDTICYNSNYTTNNGITINGLISDTVFFLIDCDTISYNLKVMNEISAQNSDSVCLGNNYTFIDGFTQTNIINQTAHLIFFYQTMAVIAY